MSRMGISLVAILLFAITAKAQPPKTMPMLMAVIRPDVQAELKLTDDQMALVQNKTGEIVKDGPGGVKYMMIRPDTDLEEIELAIKKALSAKQQKRLRECWLQILGGRALLDEAVAKEVGINPDQKSKLEALEEELREKTHAITFDGTEPNAEDVKKMKEVQEELKGRLEKVLSPEQKKKFADMQGAKFNIKQPSAAGKK